MEPGNASAVAAESAARRGAYLALVAIVLGLFAVVHVRCLVPAHRGVDQNGYLVGGRQLALTGSMALRPRNLDTGEPDPFAFVGRMWIGAHMGTPQERYYPKYPIGFPALVAAAGRTGPAAFAPERAYWVNPICMTLALAGAFLLMRPHAGSFGAFLGTAVLASSPITMTLTTNPNSHATALCLVVWGMLAVMRWSERPALGKARVAGLLLGAAVAVRYTEGLLILPLALAVLTQAALPWRDKARHGAAALLGWALPVTLLVSHNLATFGSLTGYDPTNESTGFGWTYFQDNWRTLFRQLDTNGLILLFPFGLAGMIGMFWYRWRHALLLAAWIVPCLLVYALYYWAPDSLGYLRFFLTVLPALTLCAFWLLGRVRLHPAPGAADAAAGEGPPYRRAAGAQVTGGVLTVAAILLNLDTALPAFVRDHVERDALRESAAGICAAAPAGSVIFSSDDGLLHHLQFVGDYQLHGTEAFDRRKINPLAAARLDDPQGLQPQRQQALFASVGAYSQAELHRMQERMIVQDLKSGRRVFFAWSETPPRPPRQGGAEPAREPPKAPRRRPLPPSLVLPERYAVRTLFSWVAPNGGPDAARAKRRPGKQAPPPAAKAMAIWRFSEVAATGSVSELPDVKLPKAP